MGKKISCSPIQNLRKRQVDNADDQCAEHVHPKDKSIGFIIFDKFFKYRHRTSLVHNENGVDEVDTEKYGLKGKHILNPTWIQDMFLSTIHLQRFRK